MAGRKPKPTTLKLIQGNPGKRPINKSEPVAKGEVEMPDWLSDSAKSQWEIVSKTLKQSGLLTALDSQSLALYCEAFARFKEASDALARDGAMIVTPNGMTMQSPWLAVANKSHDQMVKLLAEFGMTPSSRSKVTATKQEEVNPFARFS